MFKVIFLDAKGNIWEFDGKQFTKLNQLFSRRLTMPSDNEIKQIMTEKVFPFFEGGLDKKVLSALEEFEKMKDQMAANYEKQTKDRITEKEVRLIAEEMAARIVKKQLETVKKGVDKEMTVKIDESGRPQVVEKGSKKK